MKNSRVLSLVLVATSIGLLIGWNWTQGAAVADTPAPAPERAGVQQLPAANSAPVPPNATTAPQPVPPVVVPDAPETLPPLVFMRGGEIWRSDGTNAAPRQLTNERVYPSVGDPVMSPDGSRIAYIKWINSSDSPMPTSGLWVMNTDGSGQRAVWQPQRTLLAKPTWLPDSQSLYISANELRDQTSSSDATSPIQIVHVRLADNNVQAVLSDALSPTLADDGRALAFLRRVNGYQTTLNVAAADGSNAREIIAPGHFEEIYAPRIAPDGTRIVFAAVGGPATDAAGNVGAAHTLGVVAQLGDWLAPATAEAHGEPYDLWLINADGTGLRRLTWLSGDSLVGDFSPGGTQIVAFSAAGVYLMNSDGSDLRRISTLGEHSGSIDWTR